jgi:serine/threonine-protein kinase
VVAVALAKKPEIRYQDGDRFAADLRGLMAGLSPAAAEDDPEKKNLAVTLAAAAQAQAEVEKTLVLAATGGPAGAGYDAARPQAGGGATDEFAKTAVFNKPDVSRNDPEA